MSWISYLYETYENCKSQVGKQTGGKTMLLPIAHTTQNAQITVTLDENGNFLKAEPVDKKDAVTVIPCTEDSANRSGAAVFPHPLFDKLQYIAGDYTYFGGTKGTGFYEAYMKQLKVWCDSPYAHGDAKIICAYLSKGRLIADLVQSGVLAAGPDGRLTEKWPEESGTGFTIPQLEAFVRFRILQPGRSVDNIWLDPALWDSYISYYLSHQEERDLCYVRGEVIPTSDKHPGKIRNTADKGKLISGNDSSGFTFRGRLADKNQTLSVGFETSQKAHNALKWLVEKQGYKNGDQVFLIWGTRDEKIPETLGDSYDLLEDLSGEAPSEVDTHEGYARQLNRALGGYAGVLTESTEVVVLGLDSATTGRLSITYYQKLSGSDFLERLRFWNSTCVWLQVYKFVPDGTDDKGKAKYRHQVFFGAPNPREIVKAAYGGKANEKLSKSTIERLLPCIIEKADIPRDLVNCAVRRASMPLAMEDFEWEKTLAVACALYLKYNKKERITMALDLERNDRDYLYGRLLAVADWVERAAYRSYKKGSDDYRATTAMRSMSAFSQHPFKTWAYISERLEPYQEKLGRNNERYMDLLSEIHALFRDGEFEKDTLLNGAYLLGFYCQRKAFLDQYNEYKAKAAGKKNNFDVRPNETEESIIFNKGE